MKRTVSGSKKTAFILDPDPGTPAAVKRSHSMFRTRTGNVIVEKEKRITVRHVRALEKAGIKELKVPEEYLMGKVLAKDVVDTDTGEILTPANDRGNDRRFWRHCIHRASWRWKPCLSTI